MLDTSDDPFVVIQSKLKNLLGKPWEKSHFLPVSCRCASLHGVYCLYERTHSHKLFGPFTKKKLTTRMQQANDKQNSQSIVQL